MLFSEIKQHTLVKHLTSKFDLTKDLQVLTTALPWIKTIARQEAAFYHECSEENISQKLIQDYLLRIREYDAIDISYIIEEIRK